MQFGFTLAFWQPNLFFFFDKALNDFSNIGVGKRIGSSVTEINIQFPLEPFGNIEMIFGYALVHRRMSQ